MSYKLDNHVSVVAKTSQVHLQWVDNCNLKRHTLVKGHRLFSLYKMHATIIHFVKPGQVKTIVKH